MSKTLFGMAPRDVKTYDKIIGRTKPVLQLKDGVVVARFDSISEAARQTNILNSNISDVCRGKNKTTGGYGWKYAEYDMPIVKKKNTTTNEKYKITITAVCESKKEVSQILHSIRSVTANKPTYEIAKQ